MKKILSVMLAIMMLFGALSISASAAEPTLDDYRNNFLNNSNVIIVFNFNGGSSKHSLPVYNPEAPEGQKFVLTSGVTGTYYMLPDAGGNTLTNGSVITMPSVVPPEGKAFVGWDCTETSYDLTAGSTFILDSAIIRDAHDKHYGVIYMSAMYEAAEPEEDTLGMVLGVLIKVFGTILGILFLDGSSSAGIELMEKLLGGLLG